MMKKRLITSAITALCLSASLVVPAFAAEPEISNAATEAGVVSVLEEGLKNGLVNGATQGMKEGLKDSLKDGAKNGLVNGATQGMKEGL